ncbi:MAG: phosphatidylserine decarboxylase family protein [Bacteroidota bacterium]|nr:phosphatidylserine decarboxylase family protein [Bacteroidota bacterium]
MILHKEGYKSLRNQIIILLILTYLSQTTESQIINSIFIIMLFIFIITLYFFRIPNRNFERKNGVIYAPCDGKIVVIEETTEKEYYKDKRVQISVFMSPLNIHNNLYPISGIIAYTKYHAGKFLVAWNPKASTDNERSTIVIENNQISILCRQIAGAIARRIITYSKIKDTVNVADEIGFIKFGSRVDLFLPIDTKIKVTLGEKVIGGQSIIAKY